MLEAPKISNAMSDKHERGVALPMVLAVLVCLLAISVPFVLSMRHEQSSAQYRLHQREVQQETRFLRDYVAEVLAAGAPDLDPTPWSDDPDELAISTDALRDSLGLAVEESGAEGASVEDVSRLWSVQVEDLAGRIDLNAAPLHVIARALGLSSTLVRNLVAEDTELRVADGEAFQDSGFVWINGEVAFYGRRSGNVLYELTRPALVPGIWEPSSLRNFEPREFESGTEVIDFRAYLIATHVFRDKEETGVEGRFETVEHAMSIARAGIGALGPEHRQRLLDQFTVYGSQYLRRRWIDPQRILRDVVGGETADLRVDNGQYYGRGSIIRVRTYEGEVDYGVVIGARRELEEFVVALDVPLEIDAEAYQAVVECLPRRAVNVNSCTRRMLILLMSGLPAPNSQFAISPETAAAIADAIIAARPLQGPDTLEEVLDLMVNAGDLTLEQKEAVYVNAYNAGEFSTLGTLPFRYDMGSSYGVLAAAGLNYPLTGKEKARSFVHEVLTVSGRRNSQRILATQRDFDDLWRFSRRARGWTTHPENLNVLSPAELWNDPPGRVFQGVADFQASPSEEGVDSGAMLAPGRMLGYVRGEGVDDITLHFDFGELRSLHVEGWRLEDGAPPPLSTTGQTNVTLNARGLSNRGMSSITHNTTLRTQMKPFAVSLWWNPGGTLQDSVLFDTGQNRFEDEVLLRFEQNALVFQVWDASLPQLQSFGDPLIGTIRYEFDDGLPLEPDTWYHVTAFCAGNRPGQMALFVDHRYRGEKSFFSRLSQSLEEGRPTSGSGVSDTGFGVEDGESFPVQNGVLRIGREIVEYTERDGDQFFLGSEGNGRFGGRAARGTDQLLSDQLTHEAGTGVELYGYTIPLATERVTPSTRLAGLASRLDPFSVAILDPDQASDQIILQGSQQAIPVGAGYEADATTLPVRSPVDGVDLPRDMFQRDGGYALLVAWANPNARVNQGNNRATLDVTTSGSLFGGVECIYYQEFDGTSLTGVVRGQNLGQSVSAPPNFEVVGGGQQAYLAGHAFLVRNERIVSLTAPPLPAIWPAFVIPISVKTGDFQLRNNFPVPEQRGNGNGTSAELVQLDVDFEDESSGATEWIRYNSIVDDFFVRDDVEAVEAVTTYLGTTAGSEQTPFSSSSRIFEIGRQLDDESFSEADWAELNEQINWENLETAGGGGDAEANRLAFRGVANTCNCSHDTGALIQPVYRFYRFDTTLNGESFARPGRHDAVTMISENGQAKDSAEINWAFGRESLEDWSRRFAHVAFKDNIRQSFQRTERLGFDAVDPQEIMAEFAFIAESRAFTRMVKFPSGELPARSSERLFLGQLAGEAPGSGSTAIIDEVRVVSSKGVHETMPHGLWVLEEDLREEQDNGINLRDGGMAFPHMTRDDDLSRSYQVAGELPEDACLLLIGDEVIACNRTLAAGNQNARIAPEGRGSFGTEPGPHKAGELVTELPWMVMSRLRDGISPEDSELTLINVNGFPRSGFVMIDREVIGYSHRQTRGQAADTGEQPGRLRVPTYMHETEQSYGSLSGEAAFRGRYGTLADSHDANSVVYWFPYRYPDWYAENADFPELGCLELSFPVRRGWFRSFLWSQQTHDEMSELVAQVRVLGRGHFAGAPEADPNLFFFDTPNIEGRAHPIGRQGDELAVRFFVRYQNGALEPDEMTSNSWKRVPFLEIVGIEYSADPVVELHEERR